MATEIEVQVIRWLAEFIGYPADCGRLLVSGGNMANLTCFLAARAAQAGWDIRKQGVAGGPCLCVYASEETHTWIQKAVDLAGLGKEAIHWIGGRDPMDLGALEVRYRQDINEGFQPFLIVGFAGTVSTGAVDPLTDLAGFCREHKLWFHVDGAYGAFAAGVSEAPSELKGLQLADSVALDPHKWLYAPLEAGCALVRNRNALTNAFSYHPPYYNFEGEGLNYYDMGPQNSRGFRALKVCNHQSLQHHHTSLVPQELRASLGSMPVEDYLNQLNQRLLTAIERSGEAFVSNAIVDGKYYLRSCIVNFRASSCDIEAMPQLVVRLGRQAYRQSLMRHSRFTTTAEIYEQDLPESQRWAVERLANLVS
jgi:glutamate/tyrosine decarboxylase-like PLP-dependent enzyme